LKLTDERIERDFATYKSYLTAMESIKQVTLSLEAEPLPIVSLEDDRRR
jgi:hypothetical protein